VRRAVVRRLATTDLEFGVLLSGGIDSSVIAAVARRYTAGRLKTFSIGFEQHPVHDETPAARAVAAYLGTDHYAIQFPRVGLADVVADAYGKLDEPLADPSFLPMYLVCGEARRHVRGVLTGDGADEVLIGYRYFQVERLLDVLDRAAPASAVTIVNAVIRRAASVDARRPLRYALGLLARGLDVDPSCRFYAGQAPFSLAEAKDVLAREISCELPDGAPFRHLRRFFAGRDLRGAVERAQASVIIHFLRDTILTKVDRASMLHALEARCPFLDADLVEFASDLPLSLKLRGLTSKYVLRQVARRYLPRAVVQRTKQGFRSPIGPLLANELRPLLQDMLASAQLDHHRLFDVTCVQRMLKEHLGGERDHSRRLWTLLCFQLWERAHARAVSHARGHSV
jgi:asparagine synthase (glutamine-hydrolysing)